MRHNAPSEDANEATRFAACIHLLRTGCTLNRAAVHALAELNLTAGAFGALVELHAVGDAGIAPSELSRRVAVARRTATLYIDMLERHGWAAREPHPDDRRMILVRLRPAGRQFLDDLGEVYQQRLGALMGDMSVRQAEWLRQLLVLVPMDQAAGSSDDEH